MEIYLLITVGGLIGVMPTILLVILTAILGALLLRYQGFMTFQRVQSELAQGQIPAMAMMEGVLLLLAGALLLTPGFFTDAIGFFCLVPPLRRWLIRLLMQRVIVRSFGASNVDDSPRSDGGRTIEGDFRRRDDD
ncbi:MAG: FxsA family protein [Gammaproteobacteria bacterium]|nr:FxsA family protein [Gammaproteobacteria bacterium]MCF6230975.1 FxsA family protein [Gammaproteobacteria bacterium]